MLKKEFDLVTLGEIMLRLSPPNNERLGRGDVFEKHAGGSELNVACGTSMLGMRCGIITKLPENQIGQFIKNKVRFCGVSDDLMIFDENKDARLGVYYYESASHPRKPAVVYDRRNSSFATLSLDEVPDYIYQETRIFHTSGITMGLTEQTKETALAMIRRFKENGVLISFDVNYRANLWGEAEAKKCIESILPFVDILFISEETSRRMFQKTGALEDIMKSYCQDYPISVVATTERQIVSPHEHIFGSRIYSAKEDKFYTERPYGNIEVVDRIGSGDAYVGGVLFGILKYQDYQKAVEFGNAMSAVKNTIPGDLHASDFDEIENVIKGHKNRGQGYENEMSR